MERVLGIGGYFLRAADPAALSAWYGDVLGSDAGENGAWQQAAGADVAEKTEDLPGVGRFGWVTDPEGHRVELWQPA